MATGIGAIGRPSVGDRTKPTWHRRVGFTLGVVALGLAMVTLVANIVATGDVGEGTTARETLAWSFGLTTFAFGTIKFAIAVVLTGVLLRARDRVEAMKAALPQLKGAGGGASPAYGPLKTSYGAAVASANAPAPLLIHRIASRTWAPMLVMGVMGVGVGLALAIVQAGTSDTGDFTSLGAWVQGVGFLGEALLLAGISFLLGSILGVLRNGGGEVQASLGVTVKTLRMPLSAKVFIAAMMLGVMLGMAQFGLYIIAASVAEPAAWFAWLGPLRELSLGLLLLGIVMALYTIGTVLGFQFARVREIVTTEG